MEKRGAPVHGDVHTATAGGDGCVHAASAELLQHLQMSARVMAKHELASEPCAFAGAVGGKRGVVPSRAPWCRRPNCRQARRARPAGCAPALASRHCAGSRGALRPERSDALRAMSQSQLLIKCTQPRRSPPPPPSKHVSRENEREQRRCMRHCVHARSHGKTTHVGEAGWLGNARRRRTRGR